MTNPIFKTKEQYLSFRAAWASATKNDKAKSYLEPTDEWIKSTDSISYGTGIHRNPGWLQAEHHILYNIFREKSFDCGFTPVTNIVKLQNGMYINHGLYFGMVNLKHIQKTAVVIIVDKTATDFHKTRFAKFIEPFDGTVTVDMIANLNLPEVKPLYTNYGNSMEVAAQIIDGTFKPTNFKQVYAAISSSV